MSRRSARPWHGAVGAVGERVTGTPQAGTGALGGPWGELAPPTWAEDDPGRPPSDDLQDPDDDLQDPDLVAAGPVEVAGRVDDLHLEHVAAAELGAGQGAAVPGDALAPGGQQPGRDRPHQGRGGVLEDRDPQAGTLARRDCERGGVAVPVAG